MEGEEEGAKTEVPQETAPQQSTKALKAPITHKLKPQVFVFLGDASGFREEQEMFLCVISSTDGAAQTGDGASG